MTLTHLAAKLLPQQIQQHLKIVLDRFARKSYSQEGEDMVLSRIFVGQQTGFYVDVGAHHPMRFSNTCHFYQRRWRGINIDAMPGSMALFNRYRPRDINVEAAIASKPRDLTYYIFNEPALNGFDANLSQQRNDDDKPFHIVDTITLTTRRLADVLDNFLPSGQPIDFLSIDVEGLDLDVLRSNDWSRYRPRVILIEILDKPFRDIVDDPVSVYLRSLGYEPHAKTVNTVIFKAAAA